MTFAAKNHTKNAFFLLISLAISKKSITFAAEF